MAAQRAGRVHRERTGPGSPARPSSWRLAGTAAASAVVAGALSVVLPAGAAAGQMVTAPVVEKTAPVVEKVVRHSPRGPWTTASTTTLPPGTTTTGLGPPVPKDLGPSVPDACGGGPWAIPPGTPLAFHPAINAAYLWQGGNGGWTLDVTHAEPRARSVFSGEIIARSGTFQGVTSAALGNDIVYLSANKRTIYFRFVNFGLVDGLGFTTHCTSGFVVRVRMGLAPVPPRHDFLGADGRHPDGLPIRVSREKA